MSDVGQTRSRSAARQGAKPGHRGWGTIRKLPSKAGRPQRFQASYIGPDLARHNGPVIFSAKMDAAGWLASEKKLIDAGHWTSPARRKAEARAKDEGRRTFGDYAALVLSQRVLRPRTRDEYERLFEKVINPEFSTYQLSDITPADVRRWHAALPARPTQNARAYQLLKMVLATAVDDELIPTNPCRIRGAANVKRSSKTKLITPQEMEKLIAATDDAYRALVALAAWTGLRSGEVRELRRSDLDLQRAVVRVRRAVSLTKAGYVVGPPKSAEGARDVAIPPHVLPIVEDHLSRMAAKAGPDALLFPSAGDPARHLRESVLWAVFRDAKQKAGVESSFRLHDCRHFCGSYLTSLGATFADVMSILGHSTPAAAIKYQHSVDGRADELARRMSGLVTSDQSSGSRGHPALLLSDVVQVVPSMSNSDRC